MRLNYVQRDENRLQARSQGEDWFTPAPVERRKSPWELVRADPSAELDAADYGLFHRAMAEGLGIPGGRRAGADEPGHPEKRRSKTGKD